MTLPLSPGGKEVWALVSRPEAQRKPVGYERDFLKNYRPNIDSYLSKEEKQKLAEWGKTKKSGTTSWNLRSRNIESFADRPFLEFKQTGRQHLFSSGYGIAYP